MPTWYYPSNYSGFYGLFLYWNDITSGLFAWLSLIVLFLIVFISSKRYTTERAFSIAAFATAMSAFFYLLMNFIAFKWFILVVIGLAIAVVWLNFKGSPE